MVLLQTYRQITRVIGLYVDGVLWKAPEICPSLKYSVSFFSTSLGSYSELNVILKMLVSYMHAQFLFDENVPKNGQGFDSGLD